ncbi:MULTISPECIES: ankyrin repeat domain-containing protein [unclassified Sphingomonas]|uniref:ankyrin repeat domain-containing protein n=1 Tax=unclassified Sphingomonas TaxID=196159 RepID=UPI00215088E2|nr:MULTISPECIES: ankyrin repeat domain-containing protein [unclassified Sphingomonas]MCR5870435.1 ankyrin repeat domain-containing protein [Sphingomonas sp. J344]UUY01219.1 ankyrin repeat domain-containing protein [Sphingomonas sp. J315]
MLTVSSRLVFAAVLLCVALPAGAQRFSESYLFLKAVREQDGNKVTEYLSAPGQTIVNVKGDDGDAAIHIVAKRRDMTYLRFILARGGNVNLQDGQGNSPLMLAVEANWPEGIREILTRKGNVNLANNGGETPLMRAVQRRDLELVQLLLTSGADPDMVDRLAGLSARDYAARDTRAPAVAEALKNAPKVQKRAVSGPSF